MPRLFYLPLVEPGVYVKPKGIQKALSATYQVTESAGNLYFAARLLGAVLKNKEVLFAIAIYQNNRPAPIRITALHPKGPSSRHTVVILYHPEKLKHRLL